MFTGLVEEIGVVEELKLLDDAVRIAVRAPKVTGDAAPGDSIAVDGVCLTVVDNANGTFTADVMRETLDRSRLGTYEAGSEVNLERALAAGQRMGGHIVQGHVDGVAEVVSGGAGVVGGVLSGVEGCVGVVGVSGVVGSVVGVVGGHGRVTVVVMVVVTVVVTGGGGGGVVVGAGFTTMTLS